MKIGTLILINHSDCKIKAQIKGTLIPNANLNRRKHETSDLGSEKKLYIMVRSFLIPFHRSKFTVELWTV